ncbi:MAG TPA: lactate racemase domain-containing protein, partial [Pirellulales bacterium]
MTSYPQIFRVRQKFHAPRVADVEIATRDALAGLDLGRRIRPGESVAITVGSRGIANIALIIRAIVAHVKTLGAAPFLVPAMGSHGGGTAEGQRRIIEGYGVTEEFAGAEIRSSMETVTVCQTAEGIPVHFDKHAFGADHVIVCGRIKPHTGFVGEIESGLMKMMLIGLGKHEGAKIYHRAIQDYSFTQILQSVAGHVLGKCRIAAGLAIVENAYDESGLIEAVAPERFATREPELLRLAREWLPKLPFPICDVLLVDRIGKNLSGTGLDTNVVGRKYDDHRARPDEFPKVKRIIVRNLTPETHGNGTGIGIAEFTTQRAIDAIDWKITEINCLTGGHPTAAMRPIVRLTDRECLDAALPTIGLADPPDAKLMWIPNTLHLAEVECS